MASISDKDPWNILLMELWSREDVTADLVVAENRRSYAGHTIYRVVLKVSLIDMAFLIWSLEDWLCHN